MKKFALLTVKNHPLLEKLFYKLRSLNCIPELIIFDQKKLSQKDLIRYCERTGEEIDKLEFLDYEKIESYTYKEINHNSEDLNKIIKKHEINFLVNAGTPRIIHKNTIDNLDYGVLNCHPGILPFFRGCSCVEWAILLDKNLGNTVHWMNEGIDSGPVLETKKIKCYESDNYQDIRRRVYFEGIDLISKWIEKIHLSNHFDKYLQGELRGNGTYYKPMPNNLLLKVKQKVLEGNYKYQFFRNQN